VEVLACAARFTYISSTHQLSWSSVSELLPHCNGLRASTRAAHFSLLYLFVAEASARWLRADCAVGILLAVRRIVSSHHADDTKVCLSDLQEGTVQHLLQRAHWFCQATGQFVNPLSLAGPLCVSSLPSLGGSMAGVQIGGKPPFWAWL
jgi:hypothetical protein